MSPENDRDSALSRLREALSNSYGVEAAKILLPKVTFLGIPSDMPRYEIISAIYEKYEQLN